METPPDEILTTVIKARHRTFHVWFFRLYTLGMVRSHFRKIYIHGDFHDTGQAILLIGNHFSWWDGFLANLLNIRIFKRKLHIMMLEEQLRGRMFLNKAGAYSIRRKSRSVIESFSYTQELLAGDENLVVIYPQGEFQSLSRFPVRFEKGAERLLSDFQEAVQVVFYAALVDYFEFKKPSVNIYLRKHKMTPGSNVGDLEGSYNQFLRECIDKQLPGR